MYSKFPFSMENIPRQTRFACFSLKFGCIFSALLLILYSVLAIAQCTALLTVMSSKDTTESTGSYLMVITLGLTHCVTMFFTTVMLVGTIRQPLSTSVHVLGPIINALAYTNDCFYNSEKYQLMRPWIVWTSCQIMACILLFVFWTTMNMINHVEISLVVYVVDFLALLVRFYMLVIVSSYCKELEADAGLERLKRLSMDEPSYSAV